MLTQTLLYVLVFYVSWRVVRRLTHVNPLDAVPGPKPTSAVKGNWAELFNAQTGLQYTHDLVERFGSVVKIHGMFGAKQLFVADPTALHSIVLRDQDNFEETEAFVKGNTLTLGMGLLGTTGSHHKKQRKLLNSVFSAKHMKDLVPTFYDVTYQLRDALIAHVESTKTASASGPEVDIFDWMSRAALEYIGQGGLGYTFNGFDLAESNDYSQALKDFIPTVFRLSLLRPYTPLLIRIGSPKFRRWIVDRLPFSAVQDLKDIADTFERQSTAIYNEKKDALQKGDAAMVEMVGKGKDVMSVLLRANSAASAEDRLPENELLGQMNTLLFAAHDTMSSGLARILSLVAEKPEVQRRLREEIREARGAHGDMSYDELMALPYMDAVCRETLRLFPPVAFLARTAKETASLSLAYPVMSTRPGGPLQSTVTVEAGTTVFIAISAANRLKQVWGDDAEEWKPERWLQPLPATVTEAHMPGIYGPTMTFLGGGRACIGMKWSQLEMKLILTVLLETFQLSPSKQEIVWRLGTVVTPSVKGRNKYTPYLPLVMSMLE